MQMRKFVETQIFERIVLTLIIINALILGLDACADVPLFVREHFRVLDKFILCLFVIEIALRIMVYRKNFFTKALNSVDVIIILVSVIAEFGFINSLKVVSVLRVVRVSRFLTHHPEIKLILESIIKSLPSLIWVFGFLFTVIFLFGLAGQSLFCQLQPAHFGTIGLSMLTLLQVMTFDSWYSSVAGPIIMAYPPYVIYFILYLGITSFTLINIIVGVIIGNVTSMNEDKASRQKALALKQAFQFEGKIGTRSLVKKLNLLSDRRNLPLSVASTRYQYSVDDLYKAIRIEKGFRLRALQASPEAEFETELLIESFPGNTSYGSMTLRNSRWHVVATQANGDPNIGHFSRVLSAALESNFFCNEYYGSGELITERQFNFAKNDEYLNDDTVPLHAFDDWKCDLLTNIGNGDKVIYIGTSNAANPPWVHILCGGKKGQDMCDIEHPTVDDINWVKNIVLRLNSRLSQLPGHDAAVAEHQYYTNATTNHVTQFIRNRTGADIITVYISLKVLQFLPIDIYYSLIRYLADAIRGQGENEQFEDGTKTLTNTPSEYSS